MAIKPFSLSKNTIIGNISDKELYLKNHFDYTDYHKDVYLIRIGTFNLFKNSDGSHGFILASNVVLVFPHRFEVISF
jgi:hypothetical protein